MLKEDFEDFCIARIGATNEEIFNDGEYRIKKSIFKEFMSGLPDNILDKVKQALDFQNEIDCIEQNAIYKRGFSDALKIMNF